jgi:hypothetical protein
LGARRALILTGWFGGYPVRWVDPRGILVTPETVSDVLSLGLSVKAYNDDPSLVNGVGVTYDALATLAPVIPAGFGIINQLPKHLAK